METSFSNCLLGYFKVFRNTAERRTGHSNLMKNTYAINTRCIFNEIYLPARMQSRDEPSQNF